MPSPIPATGYCQGCHRRATQQHAPCTCLTLAEYAGWRVLMEAA